MTKIVTKSDLKKKKNEKWIGQDFSAHQQKYLIKLVSGILKKKKDANIKDIGLRYKSN